MPPMAYSAFSRPSDSSRTSGCTIATPPASMMRAARASARGSDASKSPVSRAPADTAGFTTTRSCAAIADAAASTVSAYVVGTIRMPACASSAR